VTRKVGGPALSTYSVTPPSHGENPAIPISLIIENPGPMLITRRLAYLGGREMLEAAPPFQAAVDGSAYYGHVTEQSFWAALGLRRGDMGAV
jgi:hypothetical protein